MNFFNHSLYRNNIYANTVQRFFVPDELTSWSAVYNYNPPFFESPRLIGKPYADLEHVNPLFNPKYNEIDGNVNRVSFSRNYHVEDKLPLNPFGRTGLRGRGVLGRYGPNHAADPIVSTWKRDENGKIKYENNEPILKVLCIQRADNQEIALPGGMVDAGENVSTTLKREFIEEALNGKIDHTELDEFFSKGDEIYRGYIDDLRNTDNA